MTPSATIPDREPDEFTLPPFLRRVRIRGYKSIGFCDVLLHPLTILVGRNAAGKSNFLDALAFLTDTMTFGAGEAVKRRNGWASIASRTSKSNTIEIEVEAGFKCGRPMRQIRNGNGPTARRQSDAALELTGVSFSATYCLVFSTGLQSAPTIVSESLEMMDSMNGRTAGFEVENGVISRWRSKRDTEAPLSLPHSRELLSVQRPDFPLLSVLGDQPFVEFGDGLRSMNFYNFHPDSVRFVQKSDPGAFLKKDGWNLASVIDALKENEPESVGRVRDYLVTIAREVHDFSVTRYGDYETVRFLLRGGSPNAPLEFDAANMSDGTIRALAALIAAFQIVLPKGSPSVVGIEEPETALHPAAMRALVDALDEATQRTQILLTTHSGDLLAGRDISAGQVLVVRNRDRQTYLTPVDPASREIIAKELYSLADLQRMDKLDLDEADLKRQSELVSRNGGA